MENIDIKDRKILYHLDLDSRQSFGQLGKKVGLHKDVVAYRVKRLQEKGIIKNFYTFIDFSILGYTFLRFYLSFQYVTPEIREKIIDFFLKYKYCNVIHLTEGHYDLTIFVTLKDIRKFFHSWQKAFTNYKGYFANQVLSLYCQEIVKQFSFLVDEKDREKDNKSMYEIWFGSEKIVDIDNLDFQILKLIAPNARIPTIDIAKKLDSTAVTINKRINNLEKSGIIKAYRVGIDFLKIGFRDYKVDIILKSPKDYNKILKFIESNPNLHRIIKTIGYVDIELVFVLENVDRLHQIMGDLSNKFPDAIKNYSYTSTIKTYLLNYMPKD